MLKSANMLYVKKEMDKVAYIPQKQTSKLNSSIDFLSKFVFSPKMYESWYK